MVLNKYNYGIIGCGMMGQEHIKNILYLRNQSENCYIEAICDTNKVSINETINILKKEQNNVKVYQNYKHLIDDITVNIIVISVPNYKHYEILDYCLIKNKNVLIEKPICTSISEVINIHDKLKLTDKYKIKPLLWIGMEYIYIKPINELFNKIRLNQIGEIKMISIKEHRYPFLTKVDSWNIDFKKTGGTLVEKCCHFFHLMYLLAKSKPISVYASGNLDVNIRNDTIDQKKTKIIDNAYVIVNFENGIRANLELCMFADGSKDQNYLSVIGNEGKIEAFIPSNKIIISERPNKGLYKINNVPPDFESRKINEYFLEDDTEISKLGYHYGATYWEHYNYLQSLKFKKKANIDYKQGLIAVIIGIAAELSVIENRLVFLNELICDNIISEINDINN